MEHFEYAPERGEGNYAKDCWPNEVTDHYRGYAEEHSCNSEQYPAFNAYVVFGLDYKRME